MPAGLAQQILSGLMDTEGFAALESTVMQPTYNGVKITKTTSFYDPYSSFAKSGDDTAKTDDKATDDAGKDAAGSDDKTGST